MTSKVILTVRLIHCQKLFLWNPPSGSVQQLSVPLVLLINFPLSPPGSVLARQSVKRMMSCLVSTSVYRHLYILQSSLSIFLICYGWTPLPSPTLWDIHSPPFRLALYGTRMSEASSLIFCACFAHNLTALVVRYRHRKFFIQTTRQVHLTR